jgi:hypothetical protein
MFPHKYFDKETKLFFNDKTQKWVKRINDRDRNCKVATSIYKVIQFIGINLDNELPAYNNDSNILTRVSWFLRIIYNSYRERSHEYKYFNKDQLQLILGIHYKTLLIELKGAKLIEESNLTNSHNTDQVTRAFKLSNRLLYLDISTVKEIMTVQKEGKRKTKRGTVTNKKVINAMKKYEEKYKFINVTDKKMREILLDNHSRAIIDLNSLSNLEPDSFDMIEYFNEEKQDHNYKIDQYGKRTHTIFTRLHKGLRLQIKDKNEIDAIANEADITNSQPYFLLLVFTAHNYLNKVVPVEVVNELYFLSDVIKTKAFNNYRNDVLKGILYDEYANALDEQLSDWSDLDTYDSKRNHAKKLFYQIVFSADYMCNVIRMEKEILYSLYPDVFRAVERLKSISFAEYLGSDCRPEKPYKPYKNITILLQRLESLITDMIYVELYNAGIWALKCHDSFTFKNYQTAEVKVIIADVFETLKLDAPIIKFSLTDHNI